MTEGILHPHAAEPRPAPFGVPDAMQRLESLCLAKAEYAQAANEKELYDLWLNSAAAIASAEAEVSSLYQEYLRRK